MSVASSHYDVQDTIVAVASPADPALRGIVRLTGPATTKIVQALFQPLAVPLDSQIARRYQGNVSIPLDTDPVAWPCDLWYWPTERTYTQQPSAEFHFLGAPILLQKLLQACCDQGARLAGPGEFTMRAFLAGRLDLVQAEAVLGVIHAQDPEQLKNGLAQLAGGLSHPLQTLREQLIHLLAHLEAGLDFAEEDIEFISAEELNSQLTEIQTTVMETLQQLRERHSLQQLPQVLLLGAPNAGKSSLYNVLTQGENAIVSATKGTTRDFLRTTISLIPTHSTNEVKFDLVDTAGLERWIKTQQKLSGPTQGIVEPWTKSNDIDWISEEAAAGLIQEADIAILCCTAEADSDHTQTLPWWQSLLKGTPTILLWTKSDLEHAPNTSCETAWALAQVSVSARTGQGISELREFLTQWVIKVIQQRMEKKGSIGLRAIEELESVANCLAQGKNQVAGGGGEELVAAELRNAIDSLGKLVGTIYTDDLLDSIFSRFCIGK